MNPAFPVTVSASVVFVNSSVIERSSEETVSTHSNVVLPSFFIVNLTEWLSRRRTASVSYGCPGHLVIGPVGFHVNLRDAGLAVVDAFDEQIFLGRAGELEGVHLHLPGAVEAGLGVQSRAGQQEEECEWKRIPHGDLQSDHRRLDAGTGLAKT